MNAPSMNGDGPTRAQIAMRGIDLERHQGISEEEAAQIVGLPKDTLQRIRLAVNKRPDLEPLLRNGTITIYQAQKMAGYREGPFRNYKGEGTIGWQPARGDQWEEVAHIALLYLRAQKGRGMQFPHVPPADAKRRLRQLDEMIQLLTEARDDLEPRSHKGTLSLHN
jgi:hypothetical protein